MIKATGSHPAVPAKSAGAAKAGSTEQASKGDQTHDRIARRAYELYERRGRRDGWALKDWFNAERQVVGAASHS
jgi:hypothetical protein